MKKQVQLELPEFISVSAARRRLTNLQDNRSFLQIAGLEFRKINNRWYVTRTSFEQLLEKLCAPPEHGKSLGEKICKHAAETL